MSLLLRKTSVGFTCLSGRPLLAKPAHKPGLYHLGQKSIVAQDAGQEWPEDLPMVHWRGLVNQSASVHRNQELQRRKGTQDARLRLASEEADNRARFLAPFAS
jgi:hypothetical protein